MSQNSAESATAYTDFEQIEQHKRLRIVFVSHGSQAKGNIAKL